MACTGNITGNDRNFDCFLPLYDDVGRSLDNDRRYGSRFNVNDNTTVEIRFMDVDGLQNDLEQITIMMDSHVDNFKRFMKSVHESFYKNFDIETVTNQQISRISKAVNITNQTFAALDLWLSVFSDYVSELYEDIEKYQNSKTKIVLIMNRIKQQETLSRTDTVVKFKRDEVFKQSLHSERNRLIKIENSIRSKLQNLNNYYAKFERGLIPADRKSNKMINLKTILKVADMVYGTKTKLADLQLEIIRNINSKPTSIIYRSESVPNVRERVSRPLKYIGTNDNINNDRTSGNDGNLGPSVVGEDYDMLDLSAPNELIDPSLTSQPNTSEIRSQLQPSTSRDEGTRNDSTSETLLFETTDRNVKVLPVSTSTSDDERQQRSVTNNAKNKYTRNEYINMWANQLQDAEMLLTDPNDESTGAVDDGSAASSSSVRSQIEKGIKQVRTLEQELRPIILENVRLQLYKRVNLNAVDEKIRENKISAELDRQLRLRAADLRDRENQLQRKYELQINELTADLANSTKLLDSLRAENKQVQDSLNRQLSESDKTLSEINTRYDKQTAQYNELRDLYSKLQSDLRSSINDREHSEQLTDVELTNKNTIIRDLENEQLKTRDALERCMEELQESRETMNREKTKNKNLSEILKERQNEKTILEQKHKDELDALRERETTLKAQLNDSRNRIDLLNRESKLSLDAQYGQQMSELKKKSQEFQKKYELQEIAYREKLDEKVRQLNDEMMKSTELITSTMQQKIDDLKASNDKLEIEYRVQLEKLKTNMDNQDRQENERLRLLLCEKDQRIAEISRSRDDAENRAQHLQSLNDNIDQIIEDVTKSELYPYPEDNVVGKATKSGLSKKLRNPPYKKDKHMTRSVVDNTSSKKRTSGPSSYEESRVDVDFKLERTLDDMLAHAKLPQNYDTYSPPRLYTIAEPLNIDRLQVIIDQIWLYIGNLSRDEYYIQRERIINSITFDNIKTVQPSPTDVDNYAPSDLFRYMGKGEYAATNVIFILSEYWFYYERTARFVHACIERACWTALTITMIKEFASKIVINTPDRRYAEYLEKRKTLSDHHDIIKLNNIFNNIVTDDTYNVERFNILRTNYQRSVDQQLKRRLDRVL